MQRYQSVITTAKAAQVNETIVEHFCDFAFNTAASAETKQMLKHNYEAGTRQILDIISSARVT